MLGLLVGVFLASFSLIKETNLKNEGGWVAKVDGVEISRAKYLLQIESLRIDKRNPLNKKDRDYVLERMIEEQLLIQRAKDLGMFTSNNMIRGTVVQQMINFIISNNSLTTVDDKDLEKFFLKNKGFFTNANRLRIKQIYFSDKNPTLALEKANEAFTLLFSGKSFAEALKLGSESALVVPDTLMTLSKVREYIGPSLMQLAQSLRPGEFTRPKKVVDGYKIIYLVDREDAKTPKFSSIKDLVRSEFIKRRDDQSLREYLDDLKNWYDISRNLTN
tara:strand:+ start:2119 stop:2943 length:825 start_codon:yes stop_codon:yes gene_type:complete